MLFKEAIEPFLTFSRVEKYHAPETQLKLRDCFRAWLIPQLGDIELEALNPLQVLRLREAMDAKRLGIYRQYSLLMTLKTFLKFCRTVLEINCLNPDLIKLPKRGKPNVAYLTNPEIEAIRHTINISNLSGLRLRALFEALLATGMRISECLQLDRDSIDPETREAGIIGKGNKPRTVFFSEECLAWTRRYLNARTDSCPAIFVTLAPDPVRLQIGRAHV